VDKSSKTSQTEIKMIISQTVSKVCNVSSLTTQQPEKSYLGGEGEFHIPGTNCVLRSHASLSAFTSYRVGGAAQWYVAPTDIPTLQASIQYARERDLKLTILGAGSNLLVSDQGIQGLVIATRHLRFKHFDLATGQLTVAAGESIPSLALEAASLGWEGLEWAVGIPGTVGGAVVMNAGAHSSCISDMLVKAELLLSNGSIETITPEKLGYHYRTSALQGGDRIVTQATLQMQPGADPEKVLAKTKEHKQHRLSTQPYNFPSCGSVFRNPTPYSAGWLIEQTGLKGYQIGGAQVAHLHANFIVNRGGAKANDIFCLIRHIQHKVQENWSIWLEPEVKILGDFQTIG